MNSSPTSIPETTPFALDTRSGELLYVQIANYYRQEILKGAIPKGTHLATCQEIGRALGVAAQTVNRAFDILAKEELVCRRRSVGTVANWEGGNGHKLTRSPRSPRQSTLPVCHVARMSSIVPDAHDLFMDYLNGFTEGFDAWKCRFEIAHLRDEQSDLEMVKTLVELKQVRGLVVNLLANEAVDYLIEKKFPIVLINKDESRRGATSVVADHVRGYGEAWAYADALGHREAGYFGFDVRNMEPRYRECASGRELVQPLCRLSSMVCAPEAADDEAIWASLKEAYGPWKKEGRHRKWPTLVFTQNDVIATRLMRVLREHEIRVPDDLSVIGFDDASIARQWHPTLTTLAKPRFEMALAASRLLLDLLANRAAAKGALQTFPVRLTQRESCGPRS